MSESSIAAENAQLRAELANCQARLKGTLALADERSTAAARERALKHAANNRCQRVVAVCERALARLRLLSGSPSPTGDLSVELELALADAPPALPELTALDRADLRGELEIRAAALEERAAHAEQLNAPQAAAGLRARALRVKQLLALLAVLLLCACHEWPLGAPPYAVCLEDSVPEADRAVWRAAEERWNAELGEPVLLDATSSCDVRVRAEPSLGEAACTLPVDDEVRVFYAPADLEPCVALHELAHVLLARPGHHVPGTVLDQHGCDYPDELEQVAELIREKWGL